MIFIGESINSTIPSVRDAVVNKDEEFIVKLAKDQELSGANYIDVNAGTGRGDEKEDLIWLVNLVQGVVEKPLSLDSSDVNVLLAAREICKEKPIINSVCADKKKLDAFAGLIKYGPCGVIALAHGEEGIPKDSEGRVEAGERVIEALRNMGVSDQDIYLDPILMGLSTNTEAAMLTLKTIEGIRNKYPDINIVVAISNIGFGIPKRKYLNNVFAPMAMLYGANAFIADVRDKNLIANTLAADLIMNRDPYCKNYIKAYKRGLI